MIVRLIDADAFKERLLKERDAIPKTYTERYEFGVEKQNRFGDAIRGGIKKALRCMEQTPTIDAVPVVRCGDCIYHNVPPCPMRLSLNWTKDNDFCSYGEAKGEPESEEDEVCEACAITYSWERGSANILGETNDADD